MFQQFPMPPSHLLPAPQPHPESQLIHQLRRENQMLKQQLQALINSQQSSARTSPLRLPVHFLPHPSSFQNRQDEAEVTYRNKMSKLKNRKSHRKSYEQSATAPCSPKTSAIRMQTNPNNHNPPQNGKMMVIAKDKEGRFFRDRSAEEQGSTERRGNPSQEKGRTGFPVPGQGGNRQNIKVNFVKSPVRGHQRVESAFPSSIEKTKRNYYQPSPAPTMINLLNDNPHSPWHERTLPRRNGHPQPHNPQEEGRVPRGNIYIQKVDQAERHRQQRKETTEWQSDGDSRLSIELDLKNVKSKRRLNYDIYLEEDCRH